MIQGTRNLTHIHDGESQVGNRYLGNKEVWTRQRERVRQTNFIIVCRGQIVVYVCVHNLQSKY